MNAKKAKLLRKYAALHEPQGSELGMIKREFRGVSPEGEKVKVERVQVKWTGRESFYNALKVMSLKDRNVVAAIKLEGVV
jgi:hypothetical protein